MFLIVLCVCLSPVDLQDGQVLKSQELRASLKSKVFFRFSQKSFGINLLATNRSHFLEMAIINSERTTNRRRGSFCLTPMYLLCCAMPERFGLNVQFLNVCDALCFTI